VRADRTLLAAPGVNGTQIARTAFVGATLIDGTGSPPLRNSAVVVNDGRINWVGAAAELDRTTDLRLVDVAGKYVIPGLLDANVHLVYQPDPDILLRYEPGCYDDLVLEAAQVALRAGITTVFDTWGPLESLRRVRDRINAGEVSGSRIFFAGNIIGNGGPWSADFFPSYGASLNSAVVESINQHWAQGVGAELTWMCADDVRHAVREYIATSGIDFVKYSSSAHDTVRFIAFSPDAQRAIVEEAHAAGMTAQACTMTPEALKLAIEAGVDLLQHGDVTGRRPMPPETLDLIVARELPCVALLVTERHIAAVENKGDSFGRLWREDLSLAVRDENDRRLIKAGAKLMLSIDGGVFGPAAETSPWLGPLFAGLPDVPRHLGSSHILWFQAAIERELAPMNALLAATRNIAEAYRKDDEFGTVEPGKRADVLVLDANPLDNPENYGRIAHIMKDGVLVDRERLPEHPVLTRDV
jgi:imidazolonepropionase-like amidohydrolase